MKYTFVGMEVRIGKAWKRKGKLYFRSPFDGKVRLVPKDEWVKFVDKSQAIVR